MTSSAESKFTNILIYYKELGEKKLLKQSLKELNIDKKMYLLYFKRKQVPVCALPGLKLILTSKYGFVSFCYNFYSFIDSSSNSISLCPSNIKSIAKIVISHEIGHILDPDIYTAKSEYSNILSNIIDKLIEYDIDVSSTDFHKGNLPYDLEKCALDLKRNLIDRESKAWDIAKSFIIFSNDKEELIFEKMREYALATYNFGNLKNIVREHNIDVFFRYKKYFT